jgi:S-adenosylmethionine synthetase
MKSQTNKTKITEAMTSLRQIIDEHEKEMLEDIENYRREENHQIDQYKIKLENQLKVSNLQRQALKLIISVNDQIRLLKNKFEFLSYINQTNDILQKLQIPIGIDYHISGLEHLQNIKEQIILYGTITETSKEVMPIFIDKKPEIEKLIEQYQTNQEVNLDKRSLTNQNMSIVVEILKKCTVMTHFLCHC